MPWPWVSRELAETIRESLQNLVFEKDLVIRDKDLLIEKQDAQILELQKDRKMLLDRLSYSMNVLPMYGTIPQSFLGTDEPPKKAPEDGERKPDLARDQVATPVEEAVARYGPRARQIVRVLEREADHDFDGSFAVHAMLDQDAAKVIREIEAGKSN